MPVIPTAAEESAVQEMANAFAEDDHLNDLIKENLADINGPAYLDSGVPGESSHSLRVIIRGILRAFGTDGAMVPAKGCLPAYLDANDLDEFDGTGLGLTHGTYKGWAICNGNNGTPDLRNRFVRGVETAAGATGGSDTHFHTMPTHSHTVNSHSHTISHTHEHSHTHGMPTHNHFIPIGWDDGAIYYGCTNTTDETPLYGSAVTGTVARFTASHAAAGSASIRIARTQSVDPGDTNSISDATTGSPSASNSGSTSPGTDSVDPGDTNSSGNIPAHVEMVYLMRVPTT